MCEDRKLPVQRRFVDVRIKVDSGNSFKVSSCNVVLPTGNKAVKNTNHGKVRVLLVNPNPIFDIIKKSFM